MKKKQFKFFFEQFAVTMIDDATGKGCLWTAISQNVQGRCLMPVVFVVKTNVSIPTCRYVMHSG